jgi:hypothetical protein
MKTILFPSKLRLCVWLLSVLVLSTRSKASPAPLGDQVYGVFFNEGRSAVQLNIINLKKKSAGIGSLSAGETTIIDLRNGDEARVYTPSKDMLSGRLLSTCPLPIPSSSPEYFENATRTFYFRIVGGKVVLLKPRDLTAEERKQVKAYKRDALNYGVRYPP